MPRTARREQRISLRISPRSKLVLERAAAYADKTLTDFVIDVALKEANALVRESEVIALNSDEWGRFQKLLLNPAKPNKRLNKAMSERARVVRA